MKHPFWFLEALDPRLYGWYAAYLALLIALAVVWLVNVFEQERIKL
jgi:hypothetical protein